MLFGFKKIAILVTYKGQIQAARDEAEEETKEEKINNLEKPAIVIVLRLLGSCSSSTAVRSLEVGWQAN